MSLLTKGVAKEGLPKFNLRSGRGLNPGPSGWHSDVLPIAPTLDTTHVHVYVQSRRHIDTNADTDAYTTHTSIL